MASDEGRSSENLSEVGTPADAAEQALKEKYEQAEMAKSGNEHGKSGLDDAKAMIQEDFENAKASSGREYKPPKEHSQLNTKAGGSEHETAARNLVKTAQDKLDRDDPDAAHESMGNLEQAKREIRPTG